jgi:hypothetical protein
MRQTTVTGSDSLGEYLEFDSSRDASSITFKGVSLLD